MSHGRRVCTAVVGSILMTSALAAGPPDTLPASGARVVPPIPVYVPLPRRPLPSTREELDRMPLSPWMHDLLVKDLFGETSRSSTVLALPSHKDTNDSGTTSSRGHAGRPFQIRPLDWFWNGSNPILLTNNSHPKQEPVIFGQTYSDVYGTYERIVTSYMEYTGYVDSTNGYGSGSEGIPRLHIARMSDGWSMTLPPPDPAVWGAAFSGYTTGDATVALNPNNGYMYIVGTLYNPYNSAVALWRNRYGWADEQTDPPTLPSNGFVQEGPGPTGYFFDKPSLAISLHQTSMGYLYVAVVVISNGYTWINVSRSTDDGVTWVPLGSLGAVPSIIWCPQIMVDNADGWLFLLCLDYRNNNLYLWRSTDFGNTFQFLSSTIIAAPFNGPNNDSMCPLGFSFGACIQARTAIVATLEPNSRTIGVAFHARENASLPRTSPTDVWLASYSILDNSWNQPVNLSIGLAGSQYTPAISTDPSGFFHVSFYDHSLDPDGDENFAVTEVKYRSDLGIHERATLAAPPASPRLDSGHVATFRLGEYQGSWYWPGQTWYAFIWTLPPGTQVNQEDVAYNFGSSY
jgi:hypothetical protein